MFKAACLSVVLIAMAIASIMSGVSADEGALGFDRNINSGVSTASR